MTWVKLDDRFASNPKVLRISDAALRLYVAGLCHCGLHNLDGKLDRSALPGLPAKSTAKLVAELVDAVLWLETDEGWEVKDFLLYNPSKLQVEAERDAAAERKRKWKEKNARRNGVPNGVKNTAPTQDPTRPDPKGLGTESVLTGSGGEGAPSGASPCPKCAGDRWLFDEDNNATPCPCTYLRGVI